MRRRRAMIIGYARTSTTDQAAGLAAQERDLKSAGAEKVFSEQVSSVAKRDRLKACLDFLREGDALMVTKPDRLARSTAELLTIEADLSKRGIGLVVLSMGGERLDTRNPTSKLMLTILAGVATWEREIMLERQPGQSLEQAGAGIPIEREVGFIGGLRFRGPYVRATRHAVPVPLCPAAGSAAGVQGVVSFGGNPASLAVRDHLRGG
jgi:DNA invertase Pin-like site-specific DNA recombinase